MSNSAVAYYRVSTQRQGESGLGLAAQRDAVQKYALRAGLEISSEYTEIETGTSKRERPQIKMAVADAKRTGAVLLIAKLDRLARSVKFIATLQDSGAKFIACDMPEANELTVNLMAAIAQHEAKAISQRTKSALQAAKARGQKLGSPQNLTIEGGLRGAATMRAKAIETHQQATAYAQLLRDAGESLRAIATRLNINGYKTAQGKAFKAMTVKRILDRVSAEN